MKNLFLFILLAVLASCSNKNSAQGKFDSSKGLKDFYKGYFPIGVSVSPGSLKTDEASLITKHFNSLTAENVMKMGLLQPKQDQYYWKDADSIIAFARRNNMKVRGHALVWHQQTPGWLYKDSLGRQVTKEELLRRIKDHITTVVTRYKNDVYAWDVVNEAIADAKDTVYRNSKLYQICGEEFIAKAFEWAHAADPDAILFYNDYNETNPVKRAKIISLLKTLKAKGVPVHAVGLQCHWTIYEPTKDELEQTLKDFAFLNLPLQITELDISVYPKIYDARKIESSYDTSFNEKRKDKQIEQYKMIFDLFRKYKKNITGITFWNISDRHSWLDNFPIKNRKDHPLLFDRKLKPKKAFWEVVSF